MVISFITQAPDRINKNLFPFIFNNPIDASSVNVHFNGRRVKRPINQGCQRPNYHQNAQSNIEKRTTANKVGATTFSIVTFGIKTLTIMILSIKTLCILKFSIKTLCIMKFSLKTLCIMTLSKMTLSIMTLIIMALSILTFSIRTLSITIKS